MSENYPSSSINQLKPAVSNGFVIPAIDLIDGKCVRLSQGDYNQKKIYNEHPLEVALQFEDAGIKRLHLVDLDGAKAGKVINWKVLEQLASKTSLVIDFGGGIKSFDDLQVIFNSGAGLATIGSLAVKDEALFSEMIDHIRNKWLSGNRRHTFRKIGYGRAKSRT